jgi:hypothetical protein
MSETATTTRPPPRKGGLAGPLLVVAFVLVTALHLWAVLVWPPWQRSYGDEIPFASAMFGPALEQPVAFSHRVHATDKEIDCFYCHPFGERSLNAGLPTVETCLGCHDHIIPTHDEIEKLRAFARAGREVPWVRVYYNPDHVFFPHFRHLTRGVACRECHGAVERVDRLRKVTFYMGFCLACHKTRGASRDCAACHQ